MLDRPRNDVERQMLVVHHPFSAQRLSHDENMGGAIYLSDGKPPAAKKLASAKIHCGEWYQSVILAILTIIFLILVVYELVATNNEEVRKACGESLWSFMLTRLIMTFCESGLVIMMGIIQNCMPSLLVNLENMENWVVGVGGLMLIVLHAILIAVGFLRSREAMGDIGCNDALSAASFTKDPLLGVLGFVYVGLDSIFLLIITCGVGGIFLSRVYQ